MNTRSEDDRRSGAWHLCPNQSFWPALALMIGAAGLFAIQYVRSRPQARAVAAMQAEGIAVLYGFQLSHYDEDWSSWSLHDPRPEYPFPQWLHRLVPKQANTRE